MMTITSASYITQTQYSNVSLINGSLDLKILLWPRPQLSQQQIDSPGLVYLCPNLLILIPHD